MLNALLLHKARQLSSKQSYVPVILPVDFCNGLGQLRSHGRKGIKSIGLSVNPKDSALKSRFCVPWIVQSDWETSHGFVKDLITIGRSLKGKGFLSISSEPFFHRAHEYQDELREHFILPINLKDILWLQDKEVQLCEAVKAGLNVPKTLYIRSGRQITEQSLSGFSYPLFVRAKEHAKRFYAQHGIQGAIAENFLQLLSLVDQFSSFSLIVQEYIPGDDRHRFCFGSFRGHEGDVFGVTYELIRAVRPHGSSAMIRSIDLPEISSYARKFLKAVNYIGPSDISFKYDSQKKKYYFIEINNRFWKSHSLIQACGFDLPRLQYFDAIGCLSSESLRAIRPTLGVRWWLISADIWVSLGLIKQGNLTLLNYLRTLGVPFVSGIGSWDDPLPEIHNFISMNWMLKS